LTDEAGDVKLFPVFLHTEKREDKGQTCRDVKFLGRGLKRIYCQYCQGWSKKMPVYEYECNGCRKVFEVQQRMADAPLSSCPECEGSVKKVMSMSSFQLKGGGWYADGYASTQKGVGASSTAASTPPPCSSGGCGKCPAAAG
jgi:putative FmdB family regulatory protein